MHPLRILSAPQTVTAASITQPQTSRAYPVLNNCCQPLSNTHTPKLSLYSSLFSLSSSLPYRRCHLRSNCVSPINMALDSEVPQDDRISRIASSIRIIPNFPKPGMLLFLNFEFYHFDVTFKLFRLLGWFFVVVQWCEFLFQYNLYEVLKYDFFYGAIDELCITLIENFWVYFLLFFIWF